MIRSLLDQVFWELLVDRLIAHLYPQFIEEAGLCYYHDITLIVCESAHFQFAPIVTPPNEPSRMTQLGSANLIHHVAKESLIDTLTHAQLLIQALFCLLRCCTVLLRHAFRTEWIHSSVSHLVYWHVVPYLLLGIL